MLKAPILWRNSFPLLLSFAQKCLFLRDYLWNHDPLSYIGSLKYNGLDIFERIKNNRGPLGQHAKESHGYFTFPKLEGPISNKMTFRGKDVLVWSINNYLGLADQPEVREVDAQAAKEWGMGYPMGARMMSGQTKYHEQLEAELADFSQKEDAFLLNF